MTSSCSGLAIAKNNEKIEKEQRENRDGRKNNEKILELGRMTISEISEHLV
jgi:hypothetical protein